MKKLSPEKSKPLNSILVKPAGPDCNMACEYCFYSAKTELFPEVKKHRMSARILATLIKQAMNQSRVSISFGWQGGEPTLMGLEFFKKAVELQEKYHRGQTVSNGLQTNGILLDKKWARFLRNKNFLVGVSIDGTRHVHDRYRHMVGGKGSWEGVSDSIKLLLDHGVLVNALTVINDYSVRFPDEIYLSHKESGLYHMQFIPCIEPDAGSPGRITSFSVPPRELGEFWCKIFDLWISDMKNGVPITSIRFFDSLFYRYVGLEPPDCTLLEKCGIYLAVEHNGEVFPCDFFVEPHWKLGNIMDGSLIEMLNSPRQEKFGAMKSKLAQECSQCRWLTYCLGGCVKERGFDKADKRANYFCEAYKIFFEHSHPGFKKLAEKWKAGQTERLYIKNYKPGRNDLCPCGSGKKFKKCCGG